MLPVALYAQCLTMYIAQLFQSQPAMCAINEHRGGRQADKQHATVQCSRGMYDWYI